MKWIGQHIWDLISRFRNDVYLEDVSSGTIASGGNLGLDSNNKIVKANVASGDITSVVAGTNLSGGATSGAATINLADASTSVKGAASFSSDNFAASSGAITIKDGGVNLTSEVTGVLPSANLDADTAHLSTTQTFTGAKTFNEIISGSINGNSATVTKHINLSHHHFFMNSSSTTNDFFFPYNNLNEGSSTSQYYQRTIAPYAGKIVKVIIRPSAAIGTACKLQFHKIANTDLNFGTAVEEVTNVNLNTAETSVSTAFSSATFGAGDVVNVSLIKSASGTANIQAVIVWEYTI